MTPQIQIQQTLGQIGVRYQPPLWQIRSQQADLNIHAPQGQIDIQATPDHLEIDQTQAFADEGLRTPLAFTKNEAQQAHQIAMQGVTDNVDWGHRFLHTEKGNPFSQWVMRYRGKTPDLEPKLVPGPFSVHIQVQPGQVHTHFDLQSIQIDATLHFPTIQFHSGRVQTYMAQQASVQITPPPLGQLVDQRI